MCDPSLSAIGGGVEAGRRNGGGGRRVPHGVSGRSGPARAGRHRHGRRPAAGRAAHRRRHRARGAQGDVLGTTLWLTPRALAVAVEDGVVTLTGRLERRSEADAAVRAASRIDGVVAVVDHTVDPGRRHDSGPVGRRGRGDGRRDVTGAGVPVGTRVPRHVPRDLRPRASRPPEPDGGDEATGTSGPPRSRRQ
ncbi:BON domain-containing protein [Streptomyces griseoincarnatus]